MPKRLVDTKTHIETPENVHLTFQLAGPGLRMCAYLLDLAIRTAIVFVATMIAMLAFPVFASIDLFGLPFGVMLVIAFLVEWGYGVFCEGFWNGKTPGKALFRLRVIKQGGYPIGFYDAVIRNLLRAADVLPVGYAIGLIVMSATKRMTRIGDRVADTMVIVEDSKRLNLTLPDLRRVPPLERVECQRRFHVSDRTLETVERLFDESRRLPSMRTEQLAAILSGPIARHLGFDLESMNIHLQHQRFLLRVLKTFATKNPSDANQQRPSPDKRRRQPALVGSSADASHAANSESVFVDEEDSVFVDEDVASEESVFVDEDETELVTDDEEAPFVDADDESPFVDNEESPFVDDDDSSVKEDA